jgi:fructose-bisphosphate aldolase class I
MPPIEGYCYCQKLIKRLKILAIYPHSDFLDVVANKSPSVVRIYLPLGVLVEHRVDYVDERLNAHALGRYAALCQEAGLVPIVEPEVLMDGDHTLEQCARVTEAALRTVFSQLYRQRVLLEGIILKPNMVLPGKDCPTQATVDGVADATVSCLLRAVPGAVPGVAFLSGGQDPELASARLNAMNVRWRTKAPWVLTFSYSRAIQQPALDTWKGQEINVAAAQKALYHRAKCNSMARRGEYRDEMEKP